jgi:ubiquitin
MKNDIRSTEYYKSGEHSKNARTAAKLASIASQKKAEKIRNEKVAEYLKVPKLCKQCLEVIEFKKKRNNFCSATCSATYNNTHRGSVEHKVVKVNCVDCGIGIERSAHVPKAHLRCEDCKSKNKQESLKIIREREKSEDTKGIRTTKRKVYEYTCKVCNEVFETFNKRHLTCSRDCKTEASTGQRTYQNGSRKPSWYFNKVENKEVLLDSSWEVEVATVLDSKGINWIRPKSIKWVDSTGKSRLYYPDFYLIDYDLYLDPKNPYCMSKDIDKMKQVSNVVKIEYGALEHILQVIDQV